jgi:hypothetical protein
MIDFPHLLTHDFPNTLNYKILYGIKLVFLNINEYRLQKRTRVICKSGFYLTHNHGVAGPDAKWQGHSGQDADRKRQHSSPAGWKYQCH